MNKWLLILMVFLTYSIPATAQRILEWRFGEPQIDCGESVQVCYPLLVSISEDSETPDLGTSTIRIFYDAGYLQELRLENIQNDYSINGLRESNDVYGAVLGFAGGGGVHVQFDLIANEASPLPLTTIPAHVLDFCFTLDTEVSLPLCTSLIFDNNHCGWGQGINQDDGYLTNDAGMVGTYYLNGNTSNVILADDEVVNFLWETEPAFDCRLDALNDSAGQSINSNCVRSACATAPRIGLVKTAYNNINTGVVTYTYTITNTGEQTVFDLMVTESPDGFSGTGALPVPTYQTGGTDVDGQSDAPDLLPGESMVYVADYLPTPADMSRGELVNQALASGSDAAGGPVSDLSDGNSPLDGQDNPTKTSLGTDCNTNLSCIGQLNVNLQAGCEVALTVGSTVPAYPCEVEIFVDDGTGTDHVIQGCGTYKYMVAAVDDPDNNCWGYVTAEDKQGPVLTDCPEPVSGWAATGTDFRKFVCSDVAHLILDEPASYQLDKDGTLLFESFSSERAQWIIAVTGYASFTDNCGIITVTVSDELLPGDDPKCDELRLLRTFTAVDACGDPAMASSCTQEIVFAQVELSDIHCPADISFDCEAQYRSDERGNPHPDAAGYPYFYTAFDTEDEDGDGDIYEGRGITLLDQMRCNIGASYQDSERIVICDGVYKIVRTWQILDWCTGEVLACEAQLIKVGDTSPPVVSCAQIDGNTATGLLTYSTGPYSCTAAFEVPMPVVNDNCSDWSVMTHIVSHDPDGPVVAAILPGDSRYVSGIPLGCHFIKYTVRDDCGNETIAYCPFQVEDQIEPSAVCNEGLQVSIGGQGLARVSAEDIDEGSADNCGPVRIEVRRRIPAGADYACLEMFDYDRDGKVLGDELQESSQSGDPDGEASGSLFYYTPWLEHVDFTCCDMDQNVRVELRVWDDRNGDGIAGNEISVTRCDQAEVNVIDNYNICWMDLLVEDKLPAYCVPPPSIIVDCDELPAGFDPEDAAQMTELFGAATGTDNCAGYTVEELAPQTGGLNDCGNGSFVRRFVVSDINGQRSANNCEQLVTIREKYHYKIKFPRDAASVCGDPQADTIEIEELACDLLAVSVKDEVFSASGDECYQIFRTYSVINWCEYDGISEPVVISRDEDCDGRPGDEDIWLIVETVNDPDPCAEHTAADRYSQVWYDRDDDPFNQSPAAGEKGDKCGYGGNPSGFWKEVHPLTENETLDTDGYPSKGESYCSTMASVGYWQYTQLIHVYDNVDPVITFALAEPFCSYSSDTADGCAAEVNIAFTIEENCTTEDLQITLVLDAFRDGVADDDISTSLSGSYPDYQVKGSFPLGAHYLEVSVKDGCGNQMGEQIPFEVVDCKAPAPICINGLAVELMPVVPAFDVDGDGDEDSAAMSIWASDFIVSDVSDCGGSVSYSINRLGDAPAQEQTGLVLTCRDDATLLVEVWAWDERGNGDYCETYVLVQDNRVQCTDEAGNLAGIIITEESATVQGVAIDLSGDLSRSMKTAADGHYGFDYLTRGFDYTITPGHDESPLNGVSTFDLVLMSKHILRVQPLDSPYKYIAADINNDGRITARDAIDLRRLILNIDPKYKANTSWRFIPADYVFPQPANPWSEDFPEVININNFQNDLEAQDFIAVKVGDINLSARANALSAEPRSAKGLFTITVEGRDMQAGDEYRIDFRTDQLDDIQGYQLTLRLDPAGTELVDIEYGVARAEHFGMRHADEGLLAMSWNGSVDLAGSAGEGARLFSLLLRARKDGPASEAISISSRITPAEAYDLEDNLLEIGLEFSDKGMVLPQVELYQNSPNPFRTETTIGFYLPEAGQAGLTIYDAGGRMIKMIRADFDQGYNQLLLKADELGTGSMFFYTLTTDTYTATRKMTLVR